MSEFSFEDASKPIEGFTFEQAQTPAPAPLLSQDISQDYLMRGTDVSELEMLPKAFIDRVTSGEMLKRALQRTAAPFIKAGGGFAEGFGGERLGLSEEHIHQLRELTGNSLFISTLMEQGAVPIDALLRTVSGTIGAIGAIAQDNAEQLQNQFGGDLRPDKLRSETINFLNYALMRGDIRTSRLNIDPAPWGLKEQRIADNLPKYIDFKIAAELLQSHDAENNLRELWRERGIHPAEVVFDAQRDAWLKGEVNRAPYNISDTSNIAPVQESPVPDGTPRSQLALTGQSYIDDVLSSDVTRNNIDNPDIVSNFDVPYSAAGSVPLKSRRFFIDKDFPRSMTIDGVTFDPADPFIIHDNVEQHVMEILMRAGWSADDAYRVAHYRWAQVAEHAWYRAHGIDPAKAEAAYMPFIEAIQRKKNITPPPDMYKPEYPGGDPHRAASEPVGEPEPTAAEFAEAKRIVAEEMTKEKEAAEGRAAAVGAEVTRDMPDLEKQPSPPPGRLMAAARWAIDALFDIGRDLQMKVAPMVTGTPTSRAVAKDAANAWRKNLWEWQRIDTHLVNNFTPEQRTRMFNAMDEESVMRQTGETSEHMGLATLEPEERAMVEELDRRQQLAWLHAKDLGMVEGDGIPMHATRYVMNIANATDKDQALSLDAIGRNLFTRVGQMKHRKYLTVEETEAAAKAKYGPDVKVARDIRAVALSTAKLEDAIVGRKLINNIREIGRNTGEEAIADGFKPADSEHRWFTLDHPAFRTWRPKFEVVDEKAVPIRDSGGDIVYEQVPMFVRGDFEGPLRSILQTPSGPVYGALMGLKGKAMSLIMNSPLIHNAVEFGRAFPSMPIRIWTAYAKGYRAKHDIGLMHEAINNGLVPIGKRFFNQDITAIMEEPNLTPGRSWTAKIAGFVPGLFDPGMETAVRSAIDKAGDFWHNTLLWDRIADLQMGLYVNYRADMLAKGVDPQTASRFAAHMANRYAGSLPVEAMSSAARKIANGLMFSRSFTLGNLGVMKDMLTGLPKDVMAQIERDMGEINPKAAGYAKALARRKAIAIVTMDIGLAYAGTSLLQNIFNVMSFDSTWEKELQGYNRRFWNWLEEVKANPLTVFQAPSKLSATAENEPGLQDRIHVGNAADGTGIYMRNPFGKIGEEFIGYATTPLDMIRRKGSTISRPLLNIYHNDKGFGRKVYDPDAKFPMGWIKNIEAVAKELFLTQTPEGQITAFTDLVKGDGDPKVNALSAFGPIAGVTFRRGARGGPAIGELYHARSEHDFLVQAALPDIRKQILRGDIEGANARMTELGIPPGLQRFYRRTTLNPASRLSGRTLRDFYLYSTPEQRERLERAQ